MSTSVTPKRPIPPNRSSNSSGESVFDRLFAWLDTSLIRQAGGELARECHAAVNELTCEQTRNMSRDEARGYIRAFAPEVLMKEVDLVLQRRRARESLRQQILAEAAEQLVELVIKDVSRIRSRRSVGRAA
jgi:hypothetical protein